MTYEVKESTLTPGEWVVECVTPDGMIEFTLFSGWNAEFRAKEYAGWKNRQKLKATK